MGTDAGRSGEVVVGKLPFDCIIFLSAEAS